MLTHMLFITEPGLRVVCQILCRNVHSL